MEERNETDGIRREVYLDSMFTANLGLEEVPVDSKKAVQIVRRLEQIPRDYPVADHRISEEGAWALHEVFLQAERLFENYFRQQEARRNHN